MQRTAQMFDFDAQMEESGNKSNSGNGNTTSSNSTSPVPIGKTGIAIVEEHDLTNVQELQHKSDLFSLLRPLLQQQQQHEQQYHDAQHQQVPTTQQYELLVDNTASQPCHDLVHPVDVRSRDHQTWDWKNSASTMTSNNPVEAGTSACSFPATASIASDGRTNASARFRGYQADLWQKRYQDLVGFRNTYGHCDVPYSWQENQPLAQWVKRQRYQYRLRNMGKQSTMTNERFSALQQLDFCWDYHEAAWEEKLLELSKFKAIHGHTNIPAKYPQNNQLSVWVKRQRRQYLLFANGMQTSTMTAERVHKLQAIGFDFDEHI